MKKAILYLLVFGLYTGSLAKAQNLPSFADLVEDLQPSVVNISTRHLPSDMENNDDNLGVVSPNLQIQDYFAPKNPQHLSLGSGFIISEDGYIVTNAHVIDKAQEIMVTLADGQIMSAKVIGMDSKTDLAMIKIETMQPLKTVKLGDSDAIRVGDWIIAIGNPFGLGGSVTAGIVSAKSRDIDAGAYDNFIQTDASINQGSSGGPMFNLNGEVIGINSAIYSTTGGNIGIGFATPINLAKFVIAELQSKGKVERGWLGLKIQAQSLEDGIVISSITPDSPAAESGLEAGDIILALNNELLSNPKEFSRQIAETPISSTVELKIKRNNYEFTKNLTVAAMPEISKVQAKENNQNTNNLSITVENPTLQLKEKYNITTEEFGVIITAVAQGSDAEAKGLKVGDFITHADKKPILSSADIYEAISDAKRENNRPILLLINNNNIPNFASVKL
ncbi:MAG: Do family serine endopeptidase [Alphaproteobacteria bacterium]|nr:Do family serine endopeptidase [Alphaproteobacteria bacterium]